MLGHLTLTLANPRKTLADPWALVHANLCEQRPCCVSKQAHIHPVDWPIRMILHACLRSLRAELHACIEQARSAALQLVAATTQQQHRAATHHSAGPTYTEDQGQPLQAQLHQPPACVQASPSQAPTTVCWHPSLGDTRFHTPARAWHAVISPHGQGPSAQQATWQHRTPSTQHGPTCWLHTHGGSKQSAFWPAHRHPCLPGQQRVSVLQHSSALDLQPQQFRGYKSLKKSLKPLNVRASKLAVAPYLKPKRSKRQQRELNRLKQAPIIDTVLPPVPQVPVPTEIRAIGRITGEYRLELQPAFAVVQLQGTQFKVTVDDILFVNHIRDVAVNEVVALDRVMLVGSRETTVVGRPWVPNACVLAAVEEHFKDGIVHVYKFKKRKRYRKYKQHQQALTALRVLQVIADNTAESAQLALQQQIPHVLYPDARRDSTRAEAEAPPDQPDTDEDEAAQERSAAAAV